MASTRAKRMMESQAVSPEGKGRAREAANATKRKPAGMVRKAETKKGPHFGITSFMATIAVPQKKNGETSTAHSHTNSNIPSSSSLEFSSKIATALLLSCPVLTESKPTASCSCCFSSKSVLVVSLVHLTIISLKPVKFFLFLTLLLVVVFLL